MGPRVRLTVMATHVCALSTIQVLIVNSIQMLVIIAHARTELYARQLAMETPICAYVDKVTLELIVKSIMHA